MSAVGFSCSQSARAVDVVFRIKVRTIMIRPAASAPAPPRAPLARVAAACGGLCAAGGARRAAHRVLRTECEAAHGFGRWHVCGGQVWQGLCAARLRGHVLRTPLYPLPPPHRRACRRCLLCAVLRMGAAGVRRWRVSFAPLARCRCNRAACPGGAIPSACVPAHARNRLALAFAQSGASPRHPSIAAQCRCDV